jgi:hypothetical protein
MRRISIPLALLISITAAAQSLVVIPSRPGTGATELRYPFYAGLRIRVVSPTPISVSEARSFRLRVFAGTKDELLAKKDYYGLDSAKKCFLFYTNLFTPEANAIKPTIVDLDFKRMIDERWVGNASGQLFTGRYVFVLEKSSERSVVGSIAPQIFALNDDEKFTEYFDNGVDVTVDPTGATAEKVVYLFSRNASRTPPRLRCATASADPRTVRVLVAALPESHVRVFLATLFHRPARQPVMVASLASVNTVPCSSPAF